MKRCSLTTTLPDHRVVQIYCGWDFLFIKTLAKYMPMDKPLTYLDAGSNIGCASVLFAHSIMGRGQVVAVDANPETVKVRAASRAHTAKACSLPRCSQLASRMPSAAAMLRCVRA